MRRFILLFVLCNMPALASAQDTAEISSCLGIKSDMPRLECYDSFHKYEAPEKTAASGDSDGWVTLSRTDEFTGKVLSRVYMEETGRAGERDAAVLSVICNDSGSYDVLFFKSNFINTSGRVSVRYRFDNEEPITESWIGSTGNNGAFLPDNYQDFRTHLKEAEKVVLEVTDFQGAGHRHTFENLQTNSDDLKYVMSGCASN